jgi:hypothetical protein
MFTALGAMGVETATREDLAAAVCTPRRLLPIVANTTTATKDNATRRFPFIHFLLNLFAIFHKNILVEVCMLS